MKVSLDDVIEFFKDFSFLFFRSTFCLQYVSVEKHHGAINGLYVCTQLIQKMIIYATRLSFQQIY